MTTKPLLQVLAACLITSGLLLLIAAQIHQASYEDFFYDSLDNEIALGGGTTFALRAVGVVVLLNGVVAFLTARRS